MRHMQAEQSDFLKELQYQKFALDQSAIVAATDDNGVITYVNDLFCEISGYSREELIGQTHRIVNSKFHNDNFFSELWKTIKSGQVWRGEICNQRKNGDLYWVQTTIVPFMDLATKPIKYLSIRQDITALKKAQAQLIEQQEKVVVASRLSTIGEVAATITHEINNPLAVILGRVEMLTSAIEQDQIDIDIVKKTAETIYKTAQRIERIVHSMRLLSRGSNKDEPLEDFAVDVLVADSLELVSQRFRNFGVSLRRPIHDPNIMVRCIPHEIVQVLTNLMNNSFDAVRDLKDKWISLDIIKHEDNLEFSIIDSGRGIDAQVAKRMFEPFFTTKDKQLGTGIGLSVSRTLLQNNNTDLSFDYDSEYTRFYFRLQISKPPVE